MAVASTPNQYASYQWKDDPSRKGFAQQIATAQAPNAGAQNVAQTAQAPANGAASAPASPWAQQKSAFSVPGAAPAQNSFSQMIANAQQPREQNLAAANTTISQMLAPQAGPSAEASRAMSDLDKQQAELARQTKEQSALSGRMATGQNVGDSLRLSERLMSQRADAVGEIAAADAERTQQRQQQGLSAMLSLEGLGQQAAASDASQSLAYAQLSENARQFDNQADFQEWATREGWNQDAINRAWQSQEAEKGRAFTSGESALDRALQSGQFAETMGLNRAQLSETIRQFNTKQDFDRWATQAGLDARSAELIWQSREADKARDFTAGQSSLDRELSNNQFGARLGLDQQQLSETIRQFNNRQEFDKWATQAGLDDASANRLWQSSESDKNRAYESGERELDRVLESSQFAQRLGLDKQQFTEQIRQFNSKQEFDTWAKNADIDQVEADRIWRAQQDDVNRKWQTGERLSGQEHEVFVEGLREKSDLAKMERNQVLNLQTLDQQNKYDQGLEVLRQGYESSRLQQGFSHEEAMQNMQADLQKQLQAQGYTQEQALQASRLEASRIEAERDREFQDKIEWARTVQENKVFEAQYGLDRERLNMQQQQITASLANEAERMGMDKQQFEAAMQNAEFSKSIETAAIMAEKFGDSPEMLEKSTSLIWEGLYKGGLVSKEEYEAGKLSAKAATFKDPSAFVAYAEQQGANPAIIEEIVKGMTATTTATGNAGVAPGSNEAINAAKDTLDDLYDKLPANVDVSKISAMVDGFAAIKPGSQVTGKVFDQMAKLPGGKANTKYNAADRINPNPTVTTREGADYFQFASLVNSGLTEAQAFQIAAQAIGDTRIKAAYKALTGKDWAG